MVIALLCLVAALISIAVANATDIRLFTQVSYGAHVISLAVFMLSMMSFALMLASFLTKPKFVNTWGALIVRAFVCVHVVVPCRAGCLTTVPCFAQFVTVVAMVVVFASANLYRTLDSPSTAAVWKGICSLFPWYHYGAQRVLACCVCVSAQVAVGMHVCMVAQAASWTS